MRRSTIALLSAAALLAAPHARAASGKSCTALLFSADDDQPGNSRKGAFHAAKILDVKARAVVPASVTFGKDDVVLFRFLTPKGNLYQEIEVPVASKDAPGEKERRRPGYPFPLPVQQPVSTNANGQRGQGVEARLLVGGTSVMTSGLYGTWTAEARVSDGKPCAGTFEIQP